MKKNILKIYIYEFIMFFFAIVFISLLKNLSNLEKLYTTLLFLIVMFVLLIITFKFPKEKSYLKASGIRIVISYVLFTFIIMYMLALFTGFSKGLFTLNYHQLFNGVFCNTLLLVLIELIRLVIIKNSYDNKLPIIIYLILSILCNVLAEIAAYPLNTHEQVFVFICVVVLANTANNLLATYLTKNFTFIASIIYIISMKIYPLVLPIVPNLGNYLVSCISILIPFFIYITLNKLIKTTEKSKFQEEQKGFKVLAIPLIVFLLVVIVLVSGIFKYVMIAIGSDSMYPVYARGDAVIFEKAKPSDIKTGEILVFKHNNLIITHRVVRINEIDNQLIFITKGDNNKDLDNFKTTSSDVIGKVKYKVSYIGFPTLWLNDIFRR